MQKPNFSRFVLLALGLVCLQTSAQDAGSPAADGAVIPADEFDRGTPLRSGQGFIAAVDTGDYETAAEYLDLRNLRGEATELTGAQLARRFNVIFQRATWVDIDELVDDPAGRSNDNLPDYRDSIGVVLDEGKEIRLHMQKVPRGDGVSIWKISNATVSLIPKLYEEFGYPEAVESLRHRLPNVTFLGYELFKWVLLLAVGIVAYGAVFLIAIAIRRALGDPDTPPHRRIFRFLAFPAGIWALVMSLHAASAMLGRSATAETWNRVSPVAILATVWFIFAGANLMRDIYSGHLEHRGRPGAMVLLHPAANAVKLLITVGAALIYLHKLGINITTVLAGLGIGGVAIALALQKPIEDVLGAIHLYTQQPVRVGDFCRIGDATGTIEEISLRRTHIRTLANTLIAVPNARMATEPLDNISAREKIWYRPILRLRYDTTPEQLRNILQGIQDLLNSHERVLQDNNHRVRFTEFAGDALLVEVYAYLATTDWAEYLELAEELNIRILEIVARAGTSLSLPVTLQVEQSAAADKTARST
jgi:MscS family membrane protein